MNRLYIAVATFLSLSLTAFTVSPASATPGISESHRVNATDRSNEGPEFNGFVSFNRMFPQATITDHKNTGDLTEVNFIWNGLKLQAFYSTDGEFVATSRIIDMSSLPLSAQIKLRADYADFIPHQAIEFDEVNDGLSYYVNVIGKKSSLVLRVTSDGTISVFKKMSN